MRRARLPISDAELPQAANAFNIGMRFGANQNFAGLITAFPIAYNGNNMLPADIDALFPNRAALVQAAIQQRQVAQ